MKKQPSSSVSPVDHPYPIARSDSELAEFEFFRDAFLGIISSASLKQNIASAASRGAIITEAADMALQAAKQFRARRDAFFGDA